MGKEVSFTLPFAARGKESVRGRQFYIPPKTAEFIRTCSAIFRNSSLEAPFEGALLVEVTCCFKRPKSVSLDELWMPRKPDVDNIEKSLYDAANGILWKDDCQVSLSLTRKQWASKDEIFIKILEL